MESYLGICVLLYISHRSYMAISQCSSGTDSIGASNILELSIIPLRMHS